jgi:PAS domain-containing protein
VRPTDGVLFQEIEGETVLLDPNAERYFGLDNVGTRFWQLLQEHDDLEQIVTVMLDEYDVDEATLRHDLGGLIGRLAAEGLVLEEPA